MMLTTTYYLIRKNLRQIIFLMLLSISLPVSADIMVLVHGYLGNAMSWEKSGINNELHKLGWQRAGMFRGSPMGPQLYTTNTPPNKNNNSVYVAELPSTASIMIQADVLKNILDIVEQRHKNEKIILVGHSAGGVVARMALIRHQLKNITSLITIASPHLGTYRAEQALNITANHGPFNIVKNIVGGEEYNALRHSRSLMTDLSYPQPGNLLHWLNFQPHPTIQYASIIRTNPNGELGDFYVPGFSQNMNNVATLHGKSATFVSPTSHFLHYQDASTIISIINHGKKTSH